MQADNAANRRKWSEVRRKRIGWSVSYRNRWYSRRRYGCGNVDFAEAADLAAWMVREGYQRVRVEPTL